MRIKLISELTRGDEFIWGSDKTRSNMCVHGDELGPLIFTGIELSDPNEESDPNVGGRVFFLPKSMQEGYRWFLKTDIVLVRQHDTAYGIDFRVSCMKCGDEYGEHIGMECVGGGFFIPCQDDLARFHPVYKVAIHGEEIDFFDSIGL